MSLRRSLLRGRLRRGVWLGVIAGRLCRRHGRQWRGGRLGPDRLVDPALDLLGHLGVLAKVSLHVVAPLTESLVLIGEERAGLLDDPVFDPQVEDAALARDPVAVLDVELGLAEGSG